MVLIVCNWLLMFNWFAFFERNTGALLMKTDGIREAKNGRC